MKTLLYLECHGIKTASRSEQDLLTGEHAPVNYKNNLSTYGQTVLKQLTLVLKSVLAKGTLSSTFFFAFCLKINHQYPLFLIRYWFLARGSSLQLKPQKFRNTEYSQKYWNTAGASVLGTNLNKTPAGFYQAAYIMGEHFGPGPNKVNPIPPWGLGVPKDGNSIFCSSTFEAFVAANRNPRWSFGQLQKFSVA